MARQPAGGLITVRRVNTVQPLVALTFDDGPDSAQTPAKLETLQRYGAAATFFVLGKLVEPTPELVATISAAGSEAANHSWGHPRLTRLGDDGIAREVRSTREIIAGAGGGFAPLFRPPYGESDARVAGVVAAVGYRYQVFWGVDPSDYQRPPAAEIAARVLRNVYPGAIAVLHDWVPETAAALPAILDGLAGLGYRAVTVSALLDAGEPAANWGAPPAPASCYRELRLVEPRLRGRDVLAVQEALEARGFSPGPLDGIYGPLTMRAVTAFQTQEGLPVTGVVTTAECRRLGLA